MEKQLLQDKSFIYNRVEINEQGKVVKIEPSKRVLDDIALRKYQSLVEDNDRSTTKNSGLGLIIGTIMLIFGLIMIIIFVDSIFPLYKVNVTQLILTGVVLFFLVNLVRAGLQIVITALNSQNTVFQKLEKAYSDLLKEGTLIPGIVHSVRQIKIQQSRRELDVREIVCEYKSIDGRQHVTIYLTQSTNDIKENDNILILYKNEDLSLLL